MCDYRAEALPHYAMTTTEHCGKKIVALAEGDAT